MVGRGPVAEVDAQNGVLVDRVGKDRVVNRASDELDARARLAGAVEVDRVACTGDGAADRSWTTTRDSTPLAPFPRSIVPVTSVPISLPSTTVLDDEP